jgi:hypothetical protein
MLLMLVSALARANHPKPGLPMQFRKSCLKMSRSPGAVLRHFPRFL